MRIDPKQYTLDANERHVITQALDLYAKGRTARAEKHRNATRISERSRAIIDDAEMKAARAADLIAKFADNWGPRTLRPDADRLLDNAVAASKR